VRTPNGLRPKQRRFVAEYLIDQNATQAASRAGYSVKTASAIGHENLRKPQIAQAISKGVRMLLDRPLSEAEKVIAEVKGIAHSDIRVLANGQIRPPRNV
jgi:phage terminase small subunit